MPIPCEPDSDARPVGAALTLLLLLGAGCGAAADAPRDAAGGSEAGARDAGAPDAGQDASASHDAGPGDGGTPAADAGEPMSIAGDDYVAFEDVSVPANGLLSLSFDVPDDAVSFVLTANPGSAPRRIALFSVTAPDGELIFDVNADSSPFDPASRKNLNDYAPYALMLPSSPELPLKPGRYHVQLLADPVSAPDGGTAEAAVSIDVVFKRAAKAPESGTLSVVLWFVEGSALDALDAAGDTRFISALATWREIYAGAGITLAPFDYRDLSGPEAAALTTVADDAALADLLGVLAEQAAGIRALHLVFVDTVVTAVGKTVLGKVSGLPGPPAHPGFARSGAVIVPLDNLPTTAAEIGTLFAHESAHYLGLRHTSEYDGLRHDPIADTAECPADRATQTTQAGDVVLSAADCADLDGTNLLFYTTAQGAFPMSMLTPGQAFVLLRNPLVR